MCRVFEHGKGFWVSVNNVTMKGLNVYHTEYRVTHGNIFASEFHFRHCYHKPITTSGVGVFTIAGGASRKETEDGME
jgi:hypothetical protein